MGVALLGEGEGKLRHRHLRVPSSQYLHSRLMSTQYLFIRSRILLRLIQTENHKETQKNHKPEPHEKMSPEIAPEPDNYVSEEDSDFSLDDAPGGEDEFSGSDTGDETPESDKAASKRKSRVDAQQEADGNGQGIVIKTRSMRAAEYAI